MPGARLNQPFNSSEGSTRVAREEEIDPFEPVQWVQQFREDTPMTRFVHLPAEFVRHLSRGQVYLSSHDTPTDPLEIEWSDGTVETLPASPRGDDPFGVEAAIRTALAELGSDVSPKMDAVCPIDATWANFHRSTRCSCVDDVLILLKSSERVLNALTPSRGATLALREWLDLDPRMEFRLFVRDAALVAVSHRAPLGMYRFNDDDADTLVRRLSTWFSSRIRMKFHHFRNYVVDVCVVQPRRILLIDLAPWGDQTDALLFSWDELDRADWMRPLRRAQFRAIADGPVRPARQMFYGLPVELRQADVLSDLANIAQRLVREGRSPQNGDSEPADSLATESDDDDEDDRDEALS